MNLYLVPVHLSELPVTSTSVDYYPLSLRHRRQSSSQFACTNGDIISSADVCDGIKHCADGSDETKAICINSRCPQMSFQCTYGACIDQNKRCDNNKADCVDESDEVGCNGTTKTCGSTKFQCFSGQCVDQFDVCDGHLNCNDGSDETRSLCGSIKCLPKNFQCDYGACLDISVKCNGAKDCIDGSDEDCDKPTPHIIDRSPEIPAPPTGHCRLPDQPSHGQHVRVTYCPASDRSAACRNVPGTAVISSWVLKYSCEHNYRLSSENQHSVCDNGVWDPSLRCYKLCPPLKSISADVSCFYDGQKVPCDDSMRPGSYATATCKPHYNQEYREPQDLKCQENGEWDEILLKCIPSCGVSTPPGTLVPLIQHGKVTKRGEFPWLAAIYHMNASEKWSQACGGTLITPHIILTAAHCVIDKGKYYRAEEVKVGLGKYYRDYYKEEINSVIANVREINTPPPYIGGVDSYTLDIALLDLEHSVELNNFVMPACVDWNANHVLPISSQTIGTAAGWGKTENSTPSETVMSTQLTYVSNDECRKRYVGSLRFIVNDKFCAISINGGQVLQGDSGGGLTILKNTQHFVIGVVSAKVTTGTEFSMFTQLSNVQHRLWINEKRIYFSDFHKNET